jgi:deoxyribose-phosphate aldolase
MNIKPFLDSTYLKTPEFVGISDAEDLNIVKDSINEAIFEGFKLIMIRPKHILLASQMIAKASSKVLIGTVIDFPEGESSFEYKISEAEIAIANGADELDFVCDYKAFKNNKIDLLKEEIYQCTAFCLSKNKVIKWIIEVAALSDNEIIRLCVLIKNVVIKNFKENCYPMVFVKSSTGFYKTENNLPNGATIATIILMLENASPLPIKAAGGIKSNHEAQEMIRLGVKRIGTSAAKNMSKNTNIDINY